MPSYPRKENWSHEDMHGFCIHKLLKGHRCVRVLKRWEEALDSDSFFFKKELWNKWGKNKQDANKRLDFWDEKAGLAQS